jgi:hypothetical protein
MTEEENEKAFRDTLRLIEEWGEKNKPPTLKELLTEWAFSKNKVRPDFESVNEILTIVEKWLPPSSSRNSYDWERFLKLMREKLK